MPLKMKGVRLMKNGVKNIKTVLIVVIQKDLVKKPIVKERRKKKGGRGEGRGEDMRAIGALHVRHARRAAMPTSLRNTTAFLEPSLAATSSSRAKPPNKFSVPSSVRPIAGQSKLLTLPPSSPSTTAPQSGATLTKNA
jgi:hypothetical protein